MTAIRDAWHKMFIYHIVYLLCEMAPNSNLFFMKGCSRDHYHHALKT